MFRVVIVGRPNVGKSSLFNRLTRSRRAIVGDEPGITRDRIIGYVEEVDVRFELIDTGGIIPDDADQIPSEVLRQAQSALEDADLLLFVVDGRTGLVSLDESVCSLLRAGGVETFVVVNKVDVPKLESLTAPFYALGLSEVFPVSAEHAQGMDDLLEAILRRVPEATPEEEAPDEIRVAIIGRPNMGKSSLLNRFIGKNRVIVTDIPGTTRDSVDTELEYQGQRYRLIDTAGIRRKGKTHMMADKLSVIMARRSLERADVALLLIDPVEGATKLDATIGGYAHDAGVSVIVVVNKWDLIERDTHTAAALEKEYRMKMRFLEYAPMVFVSALSGQRVFKLFEVIQEAYKARQQRIPTGELNRFLESVARPIMQSKEGRKNPVMYVSQVSTSPPTFVLFTRTRHKMHFSTERYLINKLREAFGFFATPIRIVQKIRKS